MSTHDKREFVEEETNETLEDIKKAKLGKMRRREEGGATLLRVLGRDENLPVLGRDKYLHRLRDKLEPMQEVYAMFNSLVGGIVVDPDLMTIPIHDHAIVRGHAVFDTCTVAHGRLYRVDLHLDRHLSSATRARIPLPFGKTLEENKRRMREIIAQTVVASRCRHACVRYYTSVGPGGFGVTPDGCTSAFYVVVYGAGDSSIFAGADDLEGISEYTIRDVPLKPPMLATLKSNNYMLNVLTAMSSQDKGGKFGVLLDENDNIAESCVLNCVFITAETPPRLITPPFDSILAGTTVRKVMDLARSRLVKEGVLKEVSQEVVPLATAKASAEMFLVGGDHHLLPVTSWDDEPVGTGRVGEVTKMIMQLIKQDLERGEADHYDLTYADVEGGSHAKSRRNTLALALAVGIISLLAIIGQKKTAY